MREGALPRRLSSPCNQGSIEPGLKGLLSLLTKMVGTL